MQVKHGTLMNRCFTDFNSTGNRIRRKMKASGVVVYSFDGLNQTLNTIAFHLNNKPSIWFIANATSKNFFLQNLVSFGIYEITRTPGQAESHTLYFKGLYGDVFSQMTRSDAALITDAFSGSKSSNSFDVATSTELLSFAKGDDFPPNSFVKGFFCEDVAGSCSAYYVNTAKYYYVQSAFKVARIVSSVEYDVFVWVMLVVVLYLVYIQSRRHRRDVARYVSTMVYAKRTLSVTPLLIVSILVTFTQCGLVSGGGKKGEAPWILLASGINNDTASVDEVTTGNTVTPSSPSAPIGSIPPTGSGNNTNTNGSGGYRPLGAGGGSGGAALVPVTGMYFLHPDHLGSITMITDGRGNVIAGGNNGGKSHISYTPYGSIHRTDSSGPDITRFKFTGQEEDKESGLMYYKARYYDPMVGRFLQADSMAFPDRIMGMNRYMYTEGNPLKYGDASGHKLSTAQGWTILGALVAPQYGMSAEAGAALGAGIGRHEKLREQRERRNHQVKEIGTNIAAYYFGYRTGTLGGFGYDINRRFNTRTGLRRGLDNDIKMAAIGYMLNGEEGAQWGYLLGTLKNQQTYIDRRKKLKEVYDGINFAIDLVTIFYPGAFAAETIAQTDKAGEAGFTSAKAGGTRGLGETENFTTLAIDLCVVAATAHFDNVPNNAVDSALDRVCFYSASRTNK